MSDTVADAVGTVEAGPAVPLQERLPSSGAPRRLRRQRRPTGAPPPLPRTIGGSGKLWVIGLVYVVVSTVLFLKWGPWLRVGDHIDTWILQRFADFRVGWLTTLARLIKTIGSGWTQTVAGLAAVAALMVLRRWRHLLILMISVFLVQVIGAGLYGLEARPRPYGVRIIGGWGGYSFPAPPVGTRAVLLIGILYTLVPHGRLRSMGKWAAAGLLLTLGGARMYLGVDHPSDWLISVILGVAIPVMMFRLFAPNDMFPLVRRKGNAAHLDVSGRRGEAIRHAVQDQLGLKVLAIKPFGLAGSGGSTPLRMRVEGDPDTYVFAKLYAKSHVRADRWYKLWRTILYGTLEDEASFQTVRRFVEYEDYTFRLMRDAGIPTAEPFGVVEITPEREYMLVIGFFDGAKEIGDDEVEVDDDLIDQGLGLVRKLWDAGLAHRDIKPANLLVKDGQLILIDMFFVQVRPSPWRQAVDLANMMLVLAVRSDPDRVYQRALAFFTPDEIAEAFAATRGVASPTQLRAFMKRDGRDLLARFRALAPHRRPIAIQRFSVRRVLITLAMLAVFAVAIPNGIGVFLPVQNLAVTEPPECGTGNTMILMAQSVPGATLLPCIKGLPSGWRLGQTFIRTGQTDFRLDSDLAGSPAVLVTLRPRCDVSAGLPIPSDEADTSRYENPQTLRPSFRGVRTYVFDGGCVTYRFTFTHDQPSTLVFDVDAALTFEPRAQLVAHLRRTEGLALCGVGARCPA
jgi:hypothetical protein